MRLFTILFLGSALWAGAVDTAGGRAGGESVRSSSDQVQAIFDGQPDASLKDVVKKTVMTLEQMVVSNSVPRRLKSTLSVMLGPKYLGNAVSVYDDIEKTQYNLIPSGLCGRYNGKGKEASTATYLGAPICLSRDALMELPVQALPMQIVALILHEHAHHYGFSEKDSKEVQDFVLDVFVFRKSMQDQYKLLIQLGEAQRIIAQIKKDLSKRSACFEIGRLNMLVLEMSVKKGELEKDFEGMLLGTLLSKHRLKPQYLEGIDAVEKDLRSAQDNLCFGDEWKTAKGAAGIIQSLTRADAFFGDVTVKTAQDQQ